MKKKLFVVSDIHGFYDEFIQALEDSGFDATNPNHFLISLGDHFDRGEQPFEVMSYLESLERKVLIRGNHEDLLVQLCKRTYPYLHDITNGTMITIDKLGKEFSKEGTSLFRGVYLGVKPFLDSMVDYFETKKYVFVHGFIPCQWFGEKGYNAKYLAIDWRNATKKQWESARWLNPFEVSRDVNVYNKKIVCGHWHCSAGWAKALGSSEFGKDAVWEPFEDENLIAIDACTAHTGEVNVLVLEDDFIERKGSSD